MKSCESLESPGYSVVFVCLVGGQSVIKKGVEDLINSAPESAIGGGGSK